MTSPNRGGPEAVDGLDMVGHFGVCTPVEVNLITKVFCYFMELKFWFLPKTNDCNCDTKLMCS